MPVSIEDVRRIAGTCLRPERLSVDARFSVSCESDTVIVAWELFQDRLLDESQTRQKRGFERWALRLGDQPEPLLALYRDPESGELHVVRSVLSHVREGYDSGGGVFLTREGQKWLRERIAGFDPAHYAYVMELRLEVDSALERAVVGTRLPLTPVEAPLPAFSFGHLAWIGDEDGHLARRVVSSATAGRALECWLRRIPLADLKPATAELLDCLKAGRLSATGFVSVLRQMYLDLSLSPYTDFTDKVLTLLAQLESAGYLSFESILDFEAWLLRLLGRHLTAYDLILFHHRGANYPDALLLDALLVDFRERLQRDPGQFAGENNRLRRRAFRQAYLLRRRYEGHLVPDVPTSPGERMRVYPEDYPRVPEEQLLQILRRNRQLFTAAFALTDIEKQILRDSCLDLGYTDERLELGAGLFLDRPFGGGKGPVAPDGTLLLASYATSRTVATTRFTTLASDLGLSRSEVDSFLAAPDPAGTPLEAIGPPVRQGTVSLADAGRIAGDFIFRHTLPGSVRAFLTLVDTSPLRHHLDCNRFHGTMLIARSTTGPGVVLRDSSGSALLEIEPDFSLGYTSRRGLEWPTAGWRVVAIEGSRNAKPIPLPGPVGGS